MVVVSPDSKRAFHERDEKNNQGMVSNTNWLVDGTTGAVAGKTGGMGSRRALKVGVGRDCRILSAGGRGRVIWEHASQRGAHD